MTNREMLTAIVNGEITEEVVEKAREEIAKLDKRNSDRRDKPSKRAIENAPIVEEIAKILTDKPMTASEIAEKVGISVQKASRLATQVENVKVSEVKIPKKGTRKAYSL